jgi:hypothetical protein
LRCCRLKQQVQQAVQQGPAAAGVFGVASGSATASPVKAPQDDQQPAQPQQQQQYLRLPVESAKKLRWFDREDINMLMQVRCRRAATVVATIAPVPLHALPASFCPLPANPTSTPSAILPSFPCLQLHLREKHELFEANGALRQVLRRRGVSDAQLDLEVQNINCQVDAMRQQEEGVNQVLVLAAQVRGGPASGWCIALLRLYCRVCTAEALALSSSPAPALMFCWGQRVTGCSVS